MRTADFTRAPRQGQAGAMLVVEIPAKRPSGEGGSVSLSQVAVAVQRAEGCVWSKKFRRRGYSAGMVTCYATRAEAEASALDLGGGRYPGVTITVLEAEAGGYSNGVWRAEGNVMAHIPTFTPTSVEAARGTNGPPVATQPTLARPHTQSDPGDGSDRPSESHRRRHRRATTPRKSTRPARPEVRPGARPVTDARAMFIGATKYRGPSALVQLSRTWYPMVARMQTLRGYVWHTIYWEPPFTLGTLAFFASRDDLLSFARLPAHRSLMQWITRGTRNGTGGYIRLHLAPGEHPAPPAPDAPVDPPAPHREDGAP